MRSTRIGGWIGSLVMCLIGWSGSPASANGSCAMTCADNSPGSTCMSQCSAHFPENSSGSGNASVQARRYGAIAVSPSTLEYGISYRFATRQQAVDAALTYCHTNPSKPRDCKLSVWFYNQCGSLALNPASAKSPGHWGSAWAANQSLAAKKAVTACTQAAGTPCKAVKTFCS